MKFSNSLQENLLTLLCFDSDSASIIKNVVDVGMFSSEIFREIASHAIDFHDSYGESIGEHLPDFMEDVLYHDIDVNKTKYYKKVLNNIYSFKDDINKDYVLSKLSEFIREQKLISSITKAAQLIKQGKNLDDAESIIINGLKNNLEIFNPGIVFKKSYDELLKHLQNKKDFISLGIPSFDLKGIGPSPKEILTILAPTGRGKSWGLIHIGKRSVLFRKKVLHITLEMGEGNTLLRYVQSMFSISKRESAIKSTRMILDKKGNYDGLKFIEYDRPSLKDDNIKKYISKKIGIFKDRFDLIIKQFPTGQLTLKGLESYLDLLERNYNFTPDVLIVDYVDLMKIDSRDLRIDTGIVFRNLRGLGVSRNFAVVTASQTNRTGEDAKVISLKHMGEDYSKAATSDIVIAYCQTPFEKQLGLARLFEAKVRDEEDGGTILISQNYRTGQFCLDSTYMLNDYWNDLENMEV